jgi:addiction module RelE/StbE family toxin
MEIRQTPTFVRQVKKLHKNQKKALDKAIALLAANPLIGETKKGDLKGVYVYKFSLVNQLTLLAYQYHDQQLTLLCLGSHENFYRDLKKA